MLYENILKNVSKCITLTAEETEQFTGMLTTKKVPKKTMLLEEGEICQFEGYLQKGCVRIYYLDENGFEVTLAFAVEDWWISDIASFHYHTTSSLYMETLEDSEFLMLTPDTKERLLETIPKFERVFRMLVQRRLAVLQNRLIHTSNLSRFILRYLSEYHNIILLLIWVFRRNLSVLYENGLQQRNSSSICCQWLNKLGVVLNA